ncbi:Sap1 [Kluyveromyces lactis]|nr:Sap1 [Kluyveromyces lactis]
MDNHGLLMKFSRIRKKPQQPLNSLAELYSRIANETIHYLGLEQRHEYKAAIQGWKLMATDAMYKLNNIDRQYPNFASYTEEELNLQTGIRELCDKAMKNVERVQLLCEDVPKPDNNSGKTSSIGNGGKFKVHTLRDGMYKMRYNKSGSGLGLRNDKNVQTTNPVNFSASKSLPAVIPQDPFEDFDNEVNLIDLTDAETVPYDPSPLPTFSISSDPKQEAYTDYLNISEEDMTRLKTLDKLNGTADAFSLLSVDTAEAQRPSPRRPSPPPVPPQRKPSAKQKTSASDTNVDAALKSSSPTQPKKQRPVQRRNTSISAAVAASQPQLKVKAVKRPVVTAKKSIQNGNSTSKLKKPISKSSPSLINTVVRTTSQTKTRVNPTSVTATTKTPAISTNSTITKPAPQSLDAVTQTKEQLEDELIESLPGVDKTAAKQIFSEIVVHGDEVYWDDIAGLETAKNSLKEAVVYPFLRPDLFRGLREPVRGMLLFGPPGTGKTMLARAVATESKSTFFSISASSLTSKYLGESEKLVRALFAVAKKLSPSIIFVDEIDSIMGSRNNESENESSRRIKNEFLVQWSSLSSAAAGKDSKDTDDRVLVLAATNLPWSIDEAARRRFVRRQYIPLPEETTRKVQLKRLLLNQRHTLTDEEFEELVLLTDGYSGSDITSLAKDAAMGPLRELGDKLLFTETDSIRSVNLEDFRNSLKYIKPSVSKDGLNRYEEWAASFGSSGV